MMKLLSLLVAIGLLATACTKKQASLSADEFKIGVSQEFESLNPLIMSMSASNYLYRMAARTLAVLGTNGQWYAQLATEIPTLENKQAKFITEGGKKKIQATWIIKENAKWGDGVPVTCADFQLARQIADSPMVSVAEKETYTQVERIEFDPAKPKVCTFTYEKARWDYFQLAGFTPLPKHIEGPIFEQFGKSAEGYEKNSEYVKNPTNPGLYNGPFVIAEMKLGSHVIFNPNPHFYGNPPKLKKVVVKVIPNTGTLEANLRSGQIDMISSLGLAFDQAIAFEKKVKAENLPYQVLFKDGITYEHIDFNLDNPMLKDVKVRQALIYSLNKTDLTNALFEGKQKPALHFVSPIDPWYTDDPEKITVYNHSKEKANELLDQAGWKKEADGYRYKNKEKLSFTLMTTAGNKTRELVQQFLKDQWKQVGVDIEIKNEPARVFFGETTKKRKFTGMAMYAWVSSPESNPRSSLHSKSIPSDANSWSGQNNMNWANKRVDQLIDSVDIEFNPEKRKTFVQEMMKHYTTEAPVIPLYYRADVSVVPNALKNFQLPGHQFSETNEIENWELDPSVLK